MDVVPLVWIVVPTITDAPVAENVATRPVTLGVLKGMVTVMADPSMVLEVWLAIE